TVSTLVVTGNASVTGNLNVTGNTAITGTLGVTGITSLGTAEMNAARANSLAVTNNASVGGNLGVTGNLVVAGDVTVNGTLRFGPGGTVALPEAAITAGTFGSTTVTGVASIQTLSVTGDATIRGVSTVSTLVVTGNASVSGNLMVTGNTSVVGTLGVTGITTLGTAEINAARANSLAVTGNLNVSGNTRVSGRLLIGDLSLFPNKNAYTPGFSSSTRHEIIGQIRLQFPTTNKSDLSASVPSPGVYVSYSYSNSNYPLFSIPSTSLTVNSPGYIKGHLGSLQIVLSQTNSPTTNLLEMAYAGPTEGYYEGSATFTPIRPVIIMPSFTGAGVDKMQNKRPIFLGDVSGNLIAFAGDFAERLGHRDSQMVVPKGCVVGVKNGRISLDTHDADRVMVVSFQYAVLGVYDPAELNGDHSPVAFVGQVATQIRGPVQAGDIVLASGNNDGVAVARPLSQLTPNDIPRAIGQAWEGNANEGVKLVRVAILPLNLETELLKKQAAEIDALKASVESLRQAVQALQPTR
ncbi:hypothetical protein EBZ35_03610, partial [bacterium]|nr:hypothetical protein [bacterium]